MDDFQWVSIVFTFLAGVGSLAAWLISQERIRNAEKQAREANKLARQANDLSNTANKIANQALKSETGKFRLERLEKLLYKLKEHMIESATFKIRSKEKLNYLLNDFLGFLSHIIQFERNLFRNEQIIQLSKTIREHIIDFAEAMHAYEGTMYEYKEINRDKVTVRLGHKIDNPNEKLVKKRSDFSYALKEISKSIDSKGDGLMQLLIKEIDSVHQEIGGV